MEYKKTKPHTNPGLREAIERARGKTVTQEKVAKEKTQRKAPQPNTDEDYVTTNYSLIKEASGKNLSYMDIDKQEKILSALEETSKHLAIETNIITILERMAESVVHSLGVKKVNFWDFTNDKKGVYIIAAYGMQDQYSAHSKENPIKVGEAWIGRAMQTGQAWSTSDVIVDPLMPEDWIPAAEKQGYHGLLCLPLMHGEEIIGGMCLYHQDKHMWNYSEYKIMNIVANQAATALMNSRFIADLEKEKTKTGSIVSSLSDGLILYDKHSCLQLINPRAQELLKLENTPLEGVCVDSSIKEAKPELENLLNLKDLEMDDYATKEVEIYTDKALVLEITKVPVRNDKGELIGMLQVLRDMTEQHEIEQMKSNFVSVASHQIRTPLTGVKWTIETLRSKQVGELNEQQQSMLDKASDVTKHFSELIDDLLDVSRIDEGRIDFTFEEIDVVAITKDIVHNFSPSATARSIEVNFTNDTKDEIKTIADKRQLSIAIENLVDNAIKYSPKDTGKVDIKIDANDKNLTISVADNGIGVPKEQVKFLFNKFFRANNAVRIVPNGSGLGLYITKQIVEKHDGVIEYKHNEPEGSIFSITVPIKNQPE